MKKEARRNLLLFYLGLCLFNVLFTAFNLQQKNGCSGAGCFKFLGLSLLSGLFYFGLSLTGVLLAREKPPQAAFAGMLAAGISFVVLLSDIAFYSPYVPIPKLPLLLNFTVSLAAFAYTITYATIKPGGIPGRALFAILSVMTGISGYYTITHMADGGCDGGTCTVVIIFIPVYVVYYLLLYFSLMQSDKRPTSLVRGGIFATLTFLLGLFLHASVFTEAQRDLRNDWSDPMFLLAGLGGAVFLAFFLRATQIISPLPTLPEDNAGPDNDFPSTA